MSMMGDKLAHENLEYRRPEEIERAAELEKLRKDWQAAILENGRLLACIHNAIHALFEGESPVSHFMAGSDAAKLQAGVSGAHRHLREAVESKRTTDYVYDMQAAIIALEYSLGPTRDVKTPHIKNALDIIKKRTGL